MKRTIPLLAFLFFFYAGVTQELHVMTFNIRMNTSSDGDNAWPHRKDMVASQVLFHQAHILGVQEAFHNQVTDLLERLPQYKHTGVGRDDGRTKGEYSAIFYDTTRLQLLSSGTFWLSQTPETPGSKGWDAAITRISTWARFRDRKTKKVFYHFNTHYDHIGKEARRQSSVLLLQKIKEMAGTTPVVVTGDFNAHPSDEPVCILLEAAPGLKLTDSKSISAAPHYGPSGTFNAFGPKETTNDPIDYIFVKNKVRVLQHATLSQSWGGRFSSDHFPVFATIVL